VTELELADPRRTYDRDRRGAARLLRELVRRGMPLDALPAAAELVLRLELEAHARRVLEEEGVA
jgi:hypothetical protein